MPNPIRRDKRWINLQSSLALPELIPQLREILAAVYSRLDDLDANAPSLSLPDGSIAEPKYASGSVSTRALADLGTTAGKLAADSVLLVKILDGIFTADAAGRAKFADGFVNAAKLATDSVILVKILDGIFTADASGRAKFADGFINAAKLAGDSVILVKILDGIFTADASGRAKFADSFINAAKLEADAVTKVKLAGGFSKATVIAGGAAGDHTITGIAAGDEIVCVARLNRDAVAANIDLTDITAEFTITAGNTINNAAGTDTTGDALLVTWCDLT